MDGLFYFLANLFFFQNAGGTPVRFEMYQVYYFSILYWFRYV